MKNVMVDLETRGFKPGCAILSIGAVAFGPETGKLGEEFYTVVNTASCHEAGLEDDESTMVWWNGQAEAAKKVLTEAAETETTLATALAAFGTWLGQFGSRQVKVWGNGSDFDNAILAVAYGKLGRDLPWVFWNNRCYRTIKGLYPSIKVGPRTGTYHNALDDAKTQAEHLCRIVKARGLNL